MGKEPLDKRQVRKGDYVMYPIGVGKKPELFGFGRVKRLAINPAGKHFAQVAKTDDSGRTRYVVDVPRGHARVILSSE